MLVGILRYSEDICLCNRSICMEIGLGPLRRQACCHPKRRSFVDPGERPPTMRAGTHGYGRAMGNPQTGRHQAKTMQTRTKGPRPSAPHADDGRVHKRKWRKARENKRDTTNELPTMGARCGHQSRATRHRLRDLEQAASEARQSPNRPELRRLLWLRDALERPSGQAGDLVRAGGGGDAHAQSSPSIMESDTRPREASISAGTPSQPGAFLILSLNLAASPSEKTDERQELTPSARTQWGASSHMSTRALYTGNGSAK